MSENAQGNAGNISLVSNSLNIDRGGSISSRTAGAGNAGNLDIEATERIQIDGESASGQYVSQISAAVNSTATGTGGNVNLMTERLEISQGGRVQNDTAGVGTGGNITANIVSLLIQGESSNQLRSGLTSRSSSDFAAGSLLVSARDGIVLRDGAELSVSSLFAGDAGNITLTADSLRLINDSRIDAQVAAGAQGNINLAANQLILLDQGSKITTDATNTATGGQHFALPHPSLSATTTATSQPMLCKAMAAMFQSPQRRSLA